MSEEELKAEQENLIEQAEEHAGDQAKTETPSKQERDWALFSHLSSLLGWIGLPLANIIGPLVMWQIKKEEMPFGAAQAKECMNFQISMTIYMIISFILTVVLIGFIGLIGFYIFNLIVTIIAVIKSSEGVEYRYPITMRFVK